MFLRKDVFACLEAEGAKKKAHDRPHTAEDERKFPRKSINKPSINITFTSSIKFYAILCFPEGTCPQNRYFKEQLSLTALANSR